MDTALPHPAHDEHSRFHIYVNIAMFLAVLTGIEIVIIFLPWAQALIVGTLVLLSLVKFLFVIFYFMHLRWDKVFCTILLFIGLVLAGGTMWALLAVFSVEESKRVETTALVSPSVAPARAA